MAKVSCPLCRELLDEDDPVAAGVHIGEHVGVVDLGPLLALVGNAHSLLVVAGMLCPCGLCTNDDDPPDDVERLRLEYQKGMGG